MLQRCIQAYGSVHAEAEPREFNSVSRIKNVASNKGQLNLLVELCRYNPDTSAMSPLRASDAYGRQGTIDECLLRGCRLKTCVYSFFSDGNHVSMSGQEMSSFSVEMVWPLELFHSVELSCRMHDMHTLIPREVCLL